MQAKRAYSSEFLDENFSMKDLLTSTSYNLIIIIFLTVIVEYSLKNFWLLNAFVILRLLR